MALTPMAPTPLPSIYSTTYPPATGAGTLSASNNLITTQIPNTPSARTQTYGNLAQTAATNATDFNGAQYQQGQTAQYRSLYGTGATPYTPVATQLAYTPAQTQETYRAVNPTITAGAAVSPQDSADLTKYRSLLSSSADTLANAPDRQALAQSYFDTAAKEDAPLFQSDLQDATKLASANGVLGSGMLSDRYGSIVTQHDQNLANLRQTLLNDAISGTMADRLNATNALSGLTSSTAAQEAAQRGEQRTERDYTTNLQQQNYGNATNERNVQQGIDEANLGRATTERNYADTVAQQNLARGTDERNYATALSQSNAANEFARNQAAVNQGAADTLDQQNANYRALDAFNNLQSTGYAQDAADAAALRGERGYQYGQSTDAQQSAIQQYLAQLQGQNQNFTQGVTLQQLGTAPTNTAIGANANASTSYGNDAASSFGALGQSLSQSQLQQILDAITKSQTATGTTPQNSGTYRPVIQ